MAGQGKAGQSRRAEQSIAVVKARAEQQERAEQSRTAGHGRVGGHIWQDGRAAGHIWQDGCTRQKRESKDCGGSPNFNLIYQILEFKYLPDLFVLELYVGCSGLLISLQINISK